MTIEIKQRRNGNMLMHDVFVGGKKIGHFFNTGVSHWARKTDNKPDEMEANARLIAAAPDLLDIARNMAGIDEHWLANTEVAGLRSALYALRNKARAAIAKAANPISFPRTEVRRNGERWSVISQGELIDSFDSREDAYQFAYKYDPVGSMPKKSW